MIRLSKIILFFTAVVLLAWLLPWTYRFLTVRPDRTPFTLYSCVTESFASIDFNDGEIVRHDASGKTYTDREFDSILPLFYYRQLLSDGRQPDTLRGVALTPQTVSMQSFYFRNSPSDINKVKPELYPLLEAMSGRVELQMPPDVFRIHDRIEFIDEPVDVGFDCPLDLHCTYTRDQLLVALDFLKPATVREGVKWLPEKQLDVFFVTLNKADKDYSPSTMYKDYSINESLFHWQSQSTTAENSATGQRYIHHREKGSRVLLFVREFKADARFGGAGAYTYLGTVNYVKHEGSRPMNITWKLDRPIPAKFLKKTNKLIVG